MHHEFTVNGHVTDIYVAGLQRIKATGEKIVQGEKATTFTNNKKQNKTRVCENIMYISENSIHLHKAAFISVRVASNILMVIE